MQKYTVKKRIFLSNALIVLLSLAVVALINLGIIKIYTESIEREWEQSMAQLADEQQVEEILKEWTVYRRSFVLLLLADGVLCAGTVVVISHVFTKHLTKRICEPLDELKDGAERVQDGCLTEEIVYSGDQEFEQVCTAFNSMQRHVLEEQEKNRRYEQERTHMIAGISHDLKTPLTAVQGSIKAVIDGVAATPERQDLFLKTAYRRTEDMNVLLNRLLELSRLESGATELKPEKIDLVCFLKHYVTDHRAADETERVTESLTLTCEVPYLWVVVDPDAMRRILDNLLVNSRKYSGCDSPQVQIMVTQTDGQVILCVSDNGAGVEEQQLPYLFDEFYRGDASRGQQEGNGLGLYIVKRLITAMGGQVWAENVGGLAVYMSLPEEKG